MDSAPDAPADSTLDEQRPKGRPEQQLASFDADSAEAAEPEKPEEEKKATAGAERSVGGAESPDATPSSNNETVLESRVQTNSSPPNTTQPSREIGPDSAAAPVSPPASDRNATTSAQVNTSAAPQSPTAPDPKPQSQTSSPKAQITPQDDRRLQGTAPINAATMAVGALTRAFRRPETRSQPPTPAAPADPRPSASQSLLNRFAVKNILDTLRGPQDQTHAAPPASTLSPEKAGATASTNATRAPTTNAAASPGGLRDKLATFTAERMQPRRDAEQVRGATQAARGVIASLQALEQQETTGILIRIRDAAKTNGGIENVLSEMRPGGQFEALRKEFNTVLSHDQGFAAAYDKATGAVADYAETRAALAPPSRPRGDPNLARLQTLDHEIAEAAKTLPGIKDGQSAFEDLVESGKEAVQKLFSAVQQTFSRDADLRGPSPSPGFGR
jgi:hypothetical protein